MPARNWRKYTDLELTCAVAESKTMREVLQKIGLVACGTNYENVRARMRLIGLHDQFHRSPRKQSPLRAVSDDVIRKAVPGAQSRAEVLRRLSIETTAANNKALGVRLKRMGVDCGHFLGRSAKRGKQLRPRYELPLTEVLVGDRLCSTHHLKRRLINEGVKEGRCERCRASRWFGRPLTLELHHVNGHREDNRLENLQLLCANCHSMTETYRGRNIGKTSRDRDRPYPRK